MVTILISILLIYFLAIAYNLILGRPKICPICVAVAGTWVWMLIFYLTQPSLIQPLWLGILMGGSVVGIMYQIDKKASGRLGWIIVKPLWVVTGFGLAMSIIRQQWSWVIFGGISLIILGIIIVMTMFTPSGETSPILAKLKNCC